MQQLTIQSFSSITAACCEAYFSLSYSFPAGHSCNDLVAAGSLHSSVQMPANFKVNVMGARAARKQAVELHAFTKGHCCVMTLPLEGCLSSHQLIPCCTTLASIAQPLLGNTFPAHMLPRWASQIRHSGVRFWPVLGEPISRQYDTDMSSFVGRNAIMTGLQQAVIMTGKGCCNFEHTDRIWPATQDWLLEMKAMCA